MGILVAERGHEMAMAVLMLANSQMSGDGDQYYYHGISRYKTAGIHIRNNVDRRAISVLNHPVDEGYVVVYGSTDDFTYPEGFAEDSATALWFRIDETHLAAQMVREWLEDGVHNPLLGRVE